MDRDEQRHEPRRPADTREVVAVWNETVEEHLAAQFAPSVPGLVGAAGAMDAERATTLARQLVRALRLAAISGDVQAALELLEEAGRAGGRQPTTG